MSLIAPATRYGAVLAAVALVLPGGASSAAAAPGGVTVAPPGTVRTGTVPPGTGFCTYHGIPWGLAAKVRPGKAEAARKALGSDLRAEIHDPGLGTVDLVFNNPKPVSELRSALFTGSRPVRAQSEQRDLHSCNFMLSDRPAAQHLAQVADAAVRAHHLYTPSAKAHVYEQEVSDNPWAPGTVIVTLHVDSGRSVDRFHDGGPPEEIDEAFTVVEEQSTATPTSVTRGGL